jgi:hypothetical protein
MFKKSIIRPICGYYNGCKINQQLFMRPICRYCNRCKQTTNYLWNIYLGIAYLKWPYENYNKMDVSITQFSFGSL